MWLVLAIIALIGVGAALIFRFRLAPASVTRTMISPTAAPSPKAEETVTWTDPAGFSFKYPKSVQLNAHPEDTKNYAHLEFTSAQHPGSIVVWMKDSSVADAAGWIKNDPVLKGKPSVDTTLGGYDAKKVAVKEPKPAQFVVTMDEDVVVIVETDLSDAQFWSSATDTVLSTFAFTTNQPQEQGGSQTTASDTEPQAEADEEETVE